MKLCIVGTGYVGLVTSACFADVGNNVIGVDKNSGKIEALRLGKIPIYEPHLEEIVLKNIRENRLIFTTDLMSGISDADVCFICVDTPPDGDGRAVLTNIVSAAEEMGKCMQKPLIVVTKSTVPIGTTLKLKNVIVEELKKRNKPGNWVKIASNPEFLKEGDAVNDFLKPMRVIVGADSEEVFDILHKLYAPFMLKKDRFIKMDIFSSELTKYACNGMLACRISFMNELARLAENAGADIVKIREAMGSDPRIGPDFLYAGLGYGGSCFPKDIKALMRAADEFGVRLRVIESTDIANEEQKNWFWEKIKSRFGGKLEGKKLVVWGGAFKANTDDIRFSPALFIVDKALEYGSNVSLYDPVATNKIKEVYGNKVQYFNDAYSCLAGVDALIVSTDWNEFRCPDFDKMYSLMKSPVIFDGRNICDGGMAKEKGFEYYGVGFKK